MVRQAALSNSIRLAIQTEGKNEKDEIVIYHDADGTDLSTENEMDAAKMPVTQPYSEVFINGAEDLLAIKALPNTLNDAIIPLTINTVSNGMHSISTVDVNFETDAVLWDKLTDTRTVMSSTSTYSFYADAGKYSNRFVLMLGATARKLADASLNASLIDGSLSITGTKLNGEFKLMNTQGQVVYASEFIDGQIEYHSERPITLPKGYYTVVTTSGTVKLIAR
jgi:hypothetical protein